ncbi:hypothetical protein Mmc1_3171 [Magnetococcus marinus MC-1]|uniref:Uncharacterized protein n=1 Tax=Magnetococcus marinus (strain ATCC BAA-1437 / JCM 17883 / MC-1) TaxID=156889 RepID=A0LCG8_MAGMM|nr:hypothetical protein [Magnetococcus marinus]ABK45661.1 hypothetical protein Mmc1_3171 [Magnetococcus marinus MC-1]
MNPTLKAMLVLVAVALVGWTALLPAARSGYGYSGYGGQFYPYVANSGSIFGHRGSATGWGGAGGRVSGGGMGSSGSWSGSARNGSVLGPSSSGRGLRGGK